MFIIIIVSLAFALFLKKNSVQDMKKVLSLKAILSISTLSCAIINYNSITTHATFWGTGL